MFSKHDLCSPGLLHGKSAQLEQMPGRGIDPQRLAEIAGRILGCPSTKIVEAPGTDPIFARAASLDAPSETPGTFADVILASGSTLLVCNAPHHELYADFLEVQWFPRVRFVFGVPLCGSNGTLIGALTLFDFKARKRPPDADISDVEQIGAAISYAIEARRASVPVFAN
ncbi:MAG: GAF domain-containing protein [Pseudomonadota bacterium]